MRNWKSMPVRGEPTVALVIASYLDGADASRRVMQLGSLIYSLAAQTWPRWQAVVVHDGPAGAERAQNLLAKIGDSRVRFWASTARQGDWGHRQRQPQAALADTSYVGFANDDAWFAPVYLEALLSALTVQRKRFAYCDCVHSHRLWQPLGTTIARRKIDVGGWLACRKLVASTPWTDFGFAGDWSYVAALTRACGKAAIAAKVPHCLYVHN